ncbi:hypothetical protein ACFWMS_26340 [Peribacillus butanolivorans]|uniref:hypothetical protein n=1 Tax=Peribacillus butanolivorans TaxID=421767 RepID=UPI00366792B9
MTDFADVSDVENGWRPLTAAEKLDAVSKIGAVTRWIRKRRRDLADDDPDAKYVVVDVVRFAVATGKHVGQTSFSRTVGGVTRSGTFVDPGGSLVITDFHRELLEISKTAAPSWNFGDQLG